MDSFSKIIQLTTRKVDELNADIDALENERYRKSVAELAAYWGDGKGTSVFAWLRRVRAPKVLQPVWHQDQSRISLRALLESEHIEPNQLAAELNLYVLNVAINLARMKADKSLASRAEELRGLSNQLRNVNLSGNHR